MALYDKYRGQLYIDTLPEDKVAKKSSKEKIDIEKEILGAACKNLFKT